MSRCLKPYGRGHDASASTLAAVRVLVACSVPVYTLTGEDLIEDDVPYAAAWTGT